MRPPRDSSVFLCYAQKYSFFEQRILSRASVTWNASQVHKILRAVQNTCKEFFAHSLCRALMRFVSGEIGSYFTSSARSSRLYNYTSIMIQALTGYFARSYSANLTRSFKFTLYCAPARIGGAILLCATLSNILASLPGHHWLLISTPLPPSPQKLLLFNWTIKCAFVLLGLAGLSCQTDWQKLASGSTTVHLINRYCKLKNLP